VPEHHLDRAQISTSLEEMRREGVSQHVRAQVSVQSGPQCVLGFSITHPRESGPPHGH
jgi:hypothetical protein